MISKRNKKIKSNFVISVSKHRLVPVFLFRFGFILVGMGILRQYFIDKVFQPPIQITVSQIYQTQGIPERVRAGYLFDLPVVEGEIVNGRWSVSNTVATYLNSSARLGNKGNVIIYGHNRKKIMANLHKVKVNDVILVTDEQGELWRYQVQQVVRVNPVEVSWLQETAEPVLTIYTCAGFMDSERLIVRARLLGIEKG